MKTALIGVCGLAIAGLAIIAGADSRAQEPFGDVQAMIEFQRAADAYAFSHRQIERRGQGPAARIEGTLFTPVIADAFRKRLRAATAGGACAVPEPAGGDFTVPRVNAPVEGLSVVPPCIAARLPPLPAELEYRIAGVALVLADAHLRIVVDVLHAAFTRP
jgi:hypothetical protein